MENLITFKKEKGKLKISFKYPIRGFELFLLLFGFILLALSIRGISGHKDELFSQILIVGVGLFGCILIFAIAELIILNFRVVTIDKLNGTIVINKIFRRITLKEGEITNIGIIYTLNKGITNSNGAMVGPDSHAAKISIKLKNGQIINIIPIRGLSVKDSNSKSKIIASSKFIAKGLAETLGVKVITEQAID
jgi:hypothetical protein